jgi:hypothetical protein
LIPILSKPLQRSIEKNISHYSTTDQFGAANRHPSIHSISTTSATVIYYLKAFYLTGLKRTSDLEGVNVFDVRLLNDEPNRDKDKGVWE